MGNLRLSNLARAAMTATFCMPLMVSCGSMRNGQDDEESSSPPKLSERISNLDRSKEFDKKSLDMSKTFSGTNSKEFGRSHFQGKRTSKMDSVSPNSFNTNRYNTERFESTGTEQKKPRFLFFGERNKEQKKSRFMQKRSRDDDSSSYATRSFIDRSNIDGLIGDRSERDITERVIGREFEGAGDPSPVIIRESTQSEGDIRALLKAPL